MNGEIPTTISGSSLAHAESSLRMGPPATLNLKTISAYTLANNLPTKTVETMTINPSTTDFATLSYDLHNDPTLSSLSNHQKGSSAMEFPPLFDDPSYQQAIIAELLGENHVGTDDPFAFFSSEGWGESSF